MKTYNFKQKQQGVALAVGIMLLLVVSMIGVTSMKSALLQEKMAAGLKNREYADAAAIALLRAGEAYLHTYYLSSNDTLLSPGTGPVVAPRSPEALDFRSNRDLYGGSTHPFGLDLMAFFRNGALNNVLYEEPKFMIEDLSSPYLSEVVGGVVDAGLVMGETFDDSAGGTGGSGDGSGSGGVEVRKYRIISKATDSTGNLYVGFESVVSVVTR